MKGITKYRKFRLSVIASVVSVLVVAYWDRIWSEYWLLALPFGLLVLVFFIVALTQSLIFAYNHKRITKLASLPLTINLLTLFLIFVLPLNWVRQYIEFKFRQSEMEEVVRMANHNELENVRLNSDLMQLPDNYSQLSVGGGQVIVEEVNDHKAVFFYTFRGTPDGREGFVFIPDGAKLEDCEGRLYNKILNQRDVNNNWYFILAD
ncbi:hypothetical protein [Pontibacter populi]|uniref:Uncharacterized protein n=1 Tax=Pontibacter populi TaxID=890055 RepID=A0ABV1RW11_9BACT